MMFREDEIGRTRALLGGYATRSSAASFGDTGSITAVALGNLFERAGVSDKERRKLITQALTCASGCAVLWMVTGRWLFLCGVLGVPVLQYVEIRRRIYARVESFEKDYTALLLSLASSIRTGLDPIVALYTAPELFRADSEMHRQLRGVKAAIDTGASEDAAIRGFAASIPHPDISLFRSAFLLARREGSSLGHCLERLARVTRQRQSFRRKMRSAVAMQKLSAFGIAGCAVVIGCIQGSASPEAIKATLQNPLGIKILIAGGTLIVGGIVWMLQMTRTRI